MGNIILKLGFITIAHLLKAYEHIQPISTVRMILTAMQNLYVTDWNMFHKCVL